MNGMIIFSIGKIENNEKMVCIKLKEKYAKGLKGLESYSHVQVLWWADGCDNESDRNVLLEEKPYVPSVDRIENPCVPDWCNHWPKSYEESGRFDWKSEFNF